MEPRVDPRPADDARFLQGLLEGIAAVEARGYGLLAELGGPPLRRVISVGGGARNAAWTAIRTRTLGVEVTTAATDEAAYGTARLARLALGRSES
jgi:sugar (pentulose or hexulose) kinase